MQINSLAMAGAMARANASSSTNNPSPSSASSNPAKDTNNMFLTLLSAQLENQTPFNPIDPMQFTNELVQFNMLDQLSQINSTLQQISGVAPSSSGHSIAAVSGGE